MVNLCCGQCPPRVWKAGHHRPFEALVLFQCPFIVAEMVGEDRQCQLRRAAAVVAPLEAGRTVTPQVEPGIERATIHRYDHNMAFASALIHLHAVLLSAGRRCLPTVRLRISATE